MKSFRFTFLFFALLAVAPFARATTMIYPVEAIDDLWNLPADEFRQKYSGINISGLGPSDEGWYVRYKHENLTYLFGPLVEREDARKKKWDMEAVRDAAIRNRPALTTSQVDFVRFSYSGVFGKGGGNSPYGGAGSARISKDGKSGPDGDLDGDGIPNSKDDDMDGDGIPNDKDDDIDGDGIPNGKDDYAFGADPGPDGNGTGGLAKDGSGEGGDGADGKGGKGKGGKGGKDGTGDGDGDKLAGTDGDGGGQGSEKGGKSGKSGKGGQSGSGGDGSDGSSGGQQGSSGQKGRQVASNQRGGQSGSQAGQSGQSGQQGGQSGQSGQSGSSGGQSGQSGQQSGGGSPGAAGSSGGGGGNPLSLIGSLLRMILGL